MRPLANNAQIRAMARAQRPVFVLSLQAPSVTLHAATARLAVDGVACLPVLAPRVAWSETLDAAGVRHALPGGRATAQARVEWLDLADQPAGLRALLETTPPLGLRALLRLGWLDAEDHALAEDELLTLLYGVVTHWQMRATGVALELSDDLAALAPRRAGRLLRSDMLGGAPSPSCGKPLPLVFGRHPALELLPLEHGLALRLARPIEPQNDLIFLDDVTVLPPTGRVQVGAEFIDYTYLDPYHNLLGPGGFGVSREQRQLRHTKGALLRLVPPGGFTWLVADHPCRAVRAVFADGVRLEQSAWSTSVRRLGERAAQVITLPRWPVDEAGNMARTLTAEVEGWADAQGALLEAPTDVLRWLLTDQRLGALAPGRLAEPSFAAQHARLTALGYRFARRVPGDATLGELIDSAAREAGVWLCGGATISLVGWEPTPQRADVRADYHSGNILSITRPLDVDPWQRADATLEPVAGGLPPPAIELVGPPRQGVVPRASFQFPPESIASGVIPQRVAIEWLALEGAAARDLGELAFAHAGEIPFHLELALPPGEARLLASETVALELAELGLHDALAWVRALRFDLARDPWLRAELRGPWVNAWLWQGADGAQLRRYAFGGKLDLSLHGRALARLSRDGTLRLRGALREHALPEMEAVTAPFSAAEAGLCLALPVEETWRPWALLDHAGNLLLRGTLRELSEIAFSTSEAGWGATAEACWLSANRSEAGMEWREAEGVLHLAGRLIERVRL